jgi:hypothetical protein
MRSSKTYFAVHYELGVETAPIHRLETAFDELQPAI